MKTTDLFRTSSRKLNEGLNKTFGKKIDFESFDNTKLENARNKLRTQISQIRNESGFNENMESDAYLEAQWMLDAINAELAEREELLANAGVAEVEEGFDPEEFDGEFEMEVGGDDGEEETIYVSYMAKVEDGRPVVDPESLTASSAESNPSARVDDGWASEMVAPGGNEHEYAMEIAQQGAEEQWSARDNKYDQGESTAYAHLQRNANKKTAEDVAGHDNMGFSDKEIKMAYGVMNDPRWKGADLTKQVEIIEKIAKGLSKHPGVQRAMRATSESIKGEEMSNITEGEIQQASAIVTAKTMVDRVGRWIEELSGMENDTLLQLGDSIRDEIGEQQSKAFIEAAAPSIQQALEMLKGTRDALSQAVQTLATGEAPADMLGAEPAAEPAGDVEGPAEPDEINMGGEAGDEFAAAEPAAGGIEAAGREKRESINYQAKLLKVLAG